LIPAGKRKFVIHAGNFLCHTAKVVLDFLWQKVRFVPHPPYFPDIALSAFFLFGDLKRELRASRFQTAEELLAELQKLMCEISPETLLDVFHDWMAWCESLNPNDGNYFE
jgi:hypothetical protein